MDSIETFEDKIHFLSLMEYPVAVIQAHIANGTAELLADIECIDGLHYASPPMGGWVVTEGDEVVAIHSDENRAWDESAEYGASVRFDLWAIPTHDYYPVEQRPLLNGRYITYGMVREY